MDRAPYDDAPLPPVTEPSMMDALSHQTDIELSYHLLLLACKFVCPAGLHSVCLFQNMCCLLKFSEIMSGRQSLTMTNEGSLFIKHTNSHTTPQDPTADITKDLRAQKFHLDPFCKAGLLVDQHQLYTINTGLWITNRTWTSLKYNKKNSSKPP